MAVSRCRSGQHRKFGSAFVVIIINRLASVVLVVFNQRLWMGVVMRGTAAGRRRRRRRRGRWWRGRRRRRAARRRRSGEWRMSWKRLETRQAPRIPAVVALFFFQNLENRNDIWIFKRVAARASIIVERGYNDIPWRSRRVAAAAVADGASSFRPWQTLTRDSGNLFKNSKNQILKSLDHFKKFLLAKRMFHDR